MYLQVIKGLGGNPVVIPPTEVYAALERNVVDGYCWPSVGIRDWGWEKQTKYMVDPGFYQVPNPLLVNLDTWKKLPKKLQDILTEAAVKAEKKLLLSLTTLQKRNAPYSLRKVSRSLPCLGKKVKSSSRWRTMKAGKIYWQKAPRQELN